MAIKPTTAPPVFANLVNYAVDALVPVALQGSLTKVAPIAVRTDNGQIPDVPPFAQNENYILNILTLYAIWVDEGRDTKQKDSHIQETDENGRVVAIAALLGDHVDSSIVTLDVKPNQLLPNSSHAARFETTSDTDGGAALFKDVAAGFDRRALTVQCTGESTIAPILFDATFDSGGGMGDRTALEIKGNNGLGRGMVELNSIRGTALRVRNTGAPLSAALVDIEATLSSTPLSVTHLSGSNPAARFTSTDGGATKSAPVVLTPQAYDLASTGAQSGSVWIRKFFDVVDHFVLKAYFGNSTRWIQHTRSPFCHARGEALATVTSDTDPTIYKSLVTFGFPDDLVPHEVGTVRCKVVGRVHRSSTSGTIASLGGLVLQLVDTTEGPEEVVKLWTRDLANIENAPNDLAVDFVAIKDYVLPGAGQRNFRLEFKKATVEANSETIEIEDVFVTIDAMP